MVRRDIISIVKEIGYIIAGGLAWVCQYAGLEQQMITTLGILIAIDFATGIASSISRNMTITSAKMMRDNTTKGLMFMLPFIFAISGKAIGKDVVGLVGIFIGFFIIGEIFSIIGNIYEVKTGETEKEEDAIKLLLQYTLYFFKKRVKKMIFDDFKDFKEKDDKKNK